MVATTQPLTLGEILDRTIQLYKRNLLVLAGVAAFPAAANVLVSGCFTIFLTSNKIAFQPGVTMTPQQGAMLALGVGVFLLVGMPLLLGIYAVGLSALNFAAYRLNRGEEVTVGQSYGHAFRHFWRYVGIVFLQSVIAWVLPWVVFAVVLMVGVLLIAVVAKSPAGTAFGVLFGLLMFVMAIAWIVVSVLLWLRYSLAFAASVTEEKKAWPSLKRSGELSKGTRGRIFVMYLMVGILAAVVFYAITLPVNGILGFSLHKALSGGTPTLLLQSVDLVVSFLERTLVMPVYSVALLFFYIDQRTRLEGYDIELLMDQAGWSSLPAKLPDHLTFTASDAQTHPTFELPGSPARPGEAAIPEVTSPPASLGSQEVKP